MAISEGGRSGGDSPVEEGHGQTHPEERQQLASGEEGRGEGDTLRRRDAETSVRDAAEGGWCEKREGVRDERDAGAIDVRGSKCERHWCKRYARIVRYIRETLV